MNLWDLLTNTLTIYDFCPFLFCWLGRMRLTHQLTINRRYLVSGDLRLSFSLSVIRLLVCLSVCYLYAICLPVCYPSVSVSLAYGKLSWHFRISVHPCLSLLSSLILSSLFSSPVFSILLVHVVFCLHSLRCLIMVSRHVQGRKAMATHHTSLHYHEVQKYSLGLILHFTNEGCRNHCSLHFTY